MIFDLSEEEKITLLQIENIYISICKELLTQDVKKFIETIMDPLQSKELKLSFLDNRVKHAKTLSSLFNNMANSLEELK